jgi:hypothetical protein
VVVRELPDTLSDVPTVAVEIEVVVISRYKLSVGEAVLLVNRFIPAKENVEPATKEKPFASSVFTVPPFIVLFVTPNPSSSPEV